MTSHSMKSAMIAQNVEHAFPRKKHSSVKSWKMQRRKNASKMDVSDIDGLDVIALDQQVRLGLEHL